MTASRGVKINDKKQRRALKHAEMKKQYKFLQKTTHGYTRQQLMSKAKRYIQNHGVAQG